jgi:putative permease
MRRLAVYTAIVMATVTVVIFLWQFSTILLLFTLSLTIASAARPPVINLVQRGLPLWISILLTYLAGLGILAALLLVLAPPIFAEIQDLTGRAAATYEYTWEAWTRGTTSQQVVAARFPPPSQLFEAITGSQGELLAQRIVNFLVGFSGIVGGFLIALVLSVYWTVDQTRFERLLLSLLAVGQRNRARRIWQAIENGVGAYLRSEIVQSFVGIVLLYIGYQLIGLPYPSLMALLGGIAWLVPLVGVLLTAIPVLAVGLMEGVIIAIAAFVYTLTVLLLLELVVEPRFFNRRRYSSILTVVAMLVLIQDFGILGLILAPPLSAAIQIFFTHWMAAQKKPSLAGVTDQLADLKERLASVETAINNGEAEPPPEINSIASRLGNLIRQANLALKQEL